MLTQWFPWQQRFGGQEGVCVSEVTVPIKWKKEKKPVLRALCTMREMMSRMNVSWHATLHCAALVFLEAMNDEIPVRGNKLATATLHDTTPPTSQLDNHSAPQESNQRHRNTEYCNTLQADDLDTAEKTHNAHTHTYSTYNEPGMLSSTTHTNARLDMVISFKFKPTLLFHSLYHKTYA